MTLKPIKFVQCLKSLKVDLKTFDGRKKVMNLAYLLTVFNVDIGISQKDFKWYLHSSYHPENSKFLHILEEKREPNK